MLLFKISTKLTNLWKFRLVIDNVAVDAKLIENHFSMKFHTRWSRFFCFAFDRCFPEFKSNNDCSFSLFFIFDCKFNKCMKNFEQ